MKKYVAELIGTFVLVFGGCGSAVFAGDHIGYLGVSLAFGLTLLAMAYTIGPISGCHINPAVTIGCAVAGRTKWSDVPWYVVAQVVGAIAACALLLAIDPGAPAAGFATNGYGANSPGSYDVLPAFLTECFFTMVLVLTVLGATDPKAPAGFAGVPIGLALAVTNFAAIPVTNAPATTSP